MSLNNIMLI